MNVARALATVACLFAGSVFSAVSVANASDVFSDRSPLALQVALDRARFSPGPIDGMLGTNTIKALTAFQRANRLEETGQLDDAVWETLGDAAEAPALVEYIITESDVAGPFEPLIPESLEEKAKLERLAYTGPYELLAEKFHMDIALLRRLNPGRELELVGTPILVANVGRPEAVQASRLEVDKSTGGVFVFDSTGVNIAFFPATIGSEETPSPSGKVTITRIARNPTYTYDPAKLDFKGVEATEIFEIQPGPNNPVGLVWIALDKPGYGIHGSPHPSAISRQRSHGCVRLTNWDALDLADMVSTGLPVEFHENAEVAANAGDYLPEGTGQAGVTDEHLEQPTLGIGTEYGETASEEDDIHERITQFIELEHFQDRARLAEWVDYFDKGIVSRETIIKDRRMFHARWPVRRYELIPGTVQISTIGDDQYVVSFAYEYETADPARHKTARGQGTSSVALHDLGGVFEVVDVKEIVQRSQ